MCTEQNVTVGVQESEERRSSARTMIRTMRQVPLLVESSLKASTIGSGSKVSLLSRIARSVVTSMRNELIGDVRNMITGFLQNNRMKLPTGSGDNVGRISARRAWIPLKKGKTELMMHEIAVDCVNVTKPVRFGLPKFDHGKDQGFWFRKRTSSCTRICTNRIVGSRLGSICTSLVGSS